MFDHSDNQVSALTDAINRFGERDLEILFDDEGQASTIEVHRSIERLRLIGEIDRRQTYTVAGHPSTASWLAATCRPAWGHARRLVAHARSLAHMPKTASAYARVHFCRDDRSPIGARSQALGRRWPNQPGQPAVAVPPPSPAGP